MGRLNIIVVKCLLLILSLPIAVFGQADYWAQAFDSVPESVRPRLAERFRLMMEYERTQQWDMLYDFLVKRRLPSKESFIEQRRKAAASQQSDWFVEFVPANVDKEQIDIRRADYRITGYVKVRERGCIVRREGAVYAFLRDGEWYFSGYLIALTPSHSPPPPCLSEDNR